MANQPHDSERDVFDGRHPSVEEAAQRDSARGRAVDRSPDPDKNQVSKEQRQRQEDDPDGQHNVNP